MGIDVYFARQFRIRLFKGQNHEDLTKKDIANLRKQIKKLDITVNDFIKSDIVFDDENDNESIVISPYKLDEIDEKFGGRPSVRSSPWYLVYHIITVLQVVLDNGMSFEPE